MAVGPACSPSSQTVTTGSAQTVRFAKSAGLGRFVNRIIWGAIFISRELRRTIS
jgi:hypothetical protein